MFDEPHFVNLLLPGDGVFPLISNIADWSAAEILRAYMHQSMPACIRLAMKTMTSTEAITWHRIVIAACVLVAKNFDREYLLVKFREFHHDHQESS